MFPFNLQHSHNMKKSSPVANFRQSAILRHRVGFVRNGKKVFLTPWRDNLILDSGLNKAGTVSWPDCFTHVLFGSQVAPDPVRRDSGGITFTTVGTACAASGNFFVAGDVGRLIKFNDGAAQERYITAFTDAQNVTLGAAPAPDIAGSSGTIWYVNQTALQTLQSATNNYDTTGGANGSSDVVNVRTMKRTYIGAAVGAPVTLTEIGFNNSSSNSSLFDRDIIPGGVALSTGDQPLAECNLIVTYGPAAVTAAANVGTGCDTAGDVLLNYIAGGIMSQVDSSGASSGSGLLDFIGSTGDFYVATAAITQPAFGTNPAMPARVAATSAAVSAYAPDSYFRDIVLGWTIAVANTTLHGFICGTPFVANLSWSHKFTTPFAKTSAQTLAATIRRTWTRTLTN
jgi:hypothetical protein